VLTLDKPTIEGNRVTQGLPSLSPSKRYTLDHRGATRAYQEALIHDAQDKEAAASAPDADHPTTSLEAQVGRPLTGHEIAARLRKLNGNLIFERSLAVPDKMGIYHVHDGRKDFLMGYEYGYSPEFSVRHVNDKGQFVKETRGWRTVLMRLIRQRLITASGAARLFGLPTRTSHNWQSLTT